jgi:hypothetical protein
MMGGLGFQEKLDHAQARFSAANHRLLQRMGVAEEHKDALIDETLLSMLGLLRATHEQARAKVLYVVAVYSKYAWTLNSREFTGLKNRVPRALQPLTSYRIRRCRGRPPEKASNSSTILKWTCN